MTQSLFLTKKTKRESAHDSHDSNSTELLPFVATGDAVIPNTVGLQSEST
jgi:hypothetical protein